MERVCFLALMERAPHFHLWLVPKKNEGELRGVAYMAQQPPLTTSFSEAEAMSRQDPGAVRAVTRAATVLARIGRPSRS
jgi:hypothetical protein